MHTKIIQRSLLLFLPLLLASSPISLSHKMGNNLIEKKTTDGKIIEMELLSTGKISLYKYDRGSDDYRLQTPYSPYALYFDYYVGYENSYLVQKLGHENYPIILHRLFGRISNWKHQFNIDRIQYEEIEPLIEAFNEEFK